MLRPTRMRPLLLSGVLGLAGCSGNAGLTLLSGVINDPGNADLWCALFSFGTGSICKEMTARSVPLRFRTDEPGLGRFYPASCSSQELPNQHVVVQFTGSGYAWSNVTQRLAFDAAANVEYELDFAVESGVLYVYFKAVAVTAARFQTRYLERPIPQVGMIGVNPQAAADQLGLSLLRTELSRGFTVMRDDRDQVEFGVGLTPKGKRPTQVFTSGSGKKFVVNERVEVHENQRDYIGPLVLDGDTTLTLAMEGAPAVDVMFQSKNGAWPWLGQYLASPSLGGPTAQPGIDDVLVAGRPWQKKMVVPKGVYFLIVDNTAYAGRTHPPRIPGDDRAAVVSVAVEN